MKKHPLSANEVKIMLNVNDFRSITKDKLIEFVSAMLRTSHFIIFITKHKAGCKIMKSIMYTNSAKDSDGVATFSFEDSHNFIQGLEQLSFFSQPLQSLMNELMKANSSRTIKVRELCDQEDTNMRSHFVGANVKEALRRLEEEQKIMVVSGRKQKKRNGKLNMPDEAVVRFFEVNAMSANSKIEWTETTWNPITGCTKCSSSCEHCYASTMAKRLKAMGNIRYINGFDVTIHEDLFEKPLQWKRPKLIFVNSMPDIFHESVPDEIILRLFQTMNKASWHTFQVLTKRAARLSRLSDQITWSNNIWMGVSIENKAAMNRADLLRKTGAIVNLYQQNRY